MVLDASEKQCEVDADCTARGFVEDTCIDNVCVEGKWSCLGNVPKIEETPGATHLWRGRFVEISSRMPPADLHVKLCANTDINCENPLADGLPVASDGSTEFQVPSGFEGYVELTSAEVEPAILSLGEAIVDDVDDPDAVELLPPGTVETIANILMLDYDPMRGQALALNVDCTLKPSAGITISVDTADAETVVLYIDGDLPDESLEATIDTGNSGVLNIPVGFTTFTNVRAETGEKISSVQVYMRPGFITYVNMTPTNDP